MSTDGSDADRCGYCGGAVEEGPFCSDGCRALDRELGTSDEASAAPVTDPADGRDDAAESGTERTYLRIDGAGSRTAERFLEERARSVEGVRDVEASYVTETVRVDYDPDATSATDLRDALSVAGYTAYLREETGDEGTTRREREMDGLRKRRDDDMREGRYVAAVVLGSFVMLQFLLVLYPVQTGLGLDPFVLRYLERALRGSARLPFYVLTVALTAMVVYFSGLDLFRRAYAGLVTGRPNAALLATLTVVAAAGYGSIAVVLARVDVYYDLALVVIVAATTAAYAEAEAKREAVERLTDLTTSEVETARRYEDGTTTTVPVEDLDPGDRVLVREGDRVPVDGTLDAGECTVREAVVTGESLPERRVEGEQVLGGSVIVEGSATVAVGDEVRSSIDDLTTAVWDVQSATHGVGRRVDRIAGPLAVLAVVAALAAGGWALGAGLGPVAALRYALAAVIVASPWALAVAPTVSVYGAVREALDRGVVLFDESVLERLRSVDYVAVDKTGTLTTGR